ncbi:MAG: gliding motility protein GldN [Saprospiraceae bacterium]|jgi:gliding motility associated protien GldN|nr:gliding motility protein GldN [Saprospiraceae bacterium]
MKQILFVLVILCTHSILTAQPLNDITDRNVLKEKRLMPYQPIHERDILWEKKVWRVVDVREKINLPFMYPEKPFFEIMTKAALDNQIDLYSAEFDDFSKPLTKEEIYGSLYERDTLVRIDPITYVEEIVPIENSINYENVKRFRIKEVWYFDSKTSSLNVRILGITPLLESYDENGNFRFEKPLFWMYYPSARETLSRELIFNEGNDSSPLTWEDLFEIRKFSSHIYKTSNVRNNRLQEMYSGVDLLLEADKLNQEIFNYEHDRWSF